MSKLIEGFSKFSRSAKIEWLTQNFNLPPETIELLNSFRHSDTDIQKVIDGFTENTISSFVFPYSLAPNFVINDKSFCIPMVIEESSVVAAASAAAKYWMTRGGFHSEVIATEKVGQVHFDWEGNESILRTHFPTIKQQLLADSEDLVENMQKRGGGILDVQLKTFEGQSNYYQLFVTFETCDSMGANFINSILERFAGSLEIILPQLPDTQDVEPKIIMSILSNYTPDCIVKTKVQCPIEALGTYEGLSSHELAYKFKRAVDIAGFDTYRATTHNKGIYNGIDAVVLATGNDFRAVESCGHTHAAATGQYKSLSTCSIDNGIFQFSLEIPMALGTIGGLTKLHPLAKISLEILGNPSATELMEIVGAVGLAQNFAAVRSLVTSGIQKGHMKMHLCNILNHLNVNEIENDLVMAHFNDKPISFSAVRNYIEQIRAITPI